MIIELNITTNPDGTFNVFLDGECIVENSDHPYGAAAVVLHERGYSRDDRMHGRVNGDERLSALISISYALDRGPGQKAREAAMAPVSIQDLIARKRQEAWEKANRP
ncbi:hypothetical protein WDZ92_17520 [Nostoc sp. NIES-2111]